jgi:hypothetical protein
MDNDHNVSFSADWLSQIAQQAAALDKLQAEKAEQHGRQWARALLSLQSPASVVVDALESRGLGIWRMCGDACLTSEQWRFARRTTCGANEALSFMIGVTSEIEQHTRETANS